MQQASITLRNFQINHLIPLLFCLAFYSGLQAQCFDPCDQHPAPSNVCDTAVPMQFDVPICASSVGYTADHWGNLEQVFCGGLHNNAFYQFIADTPDIDIPWWVLSGSFCDRGLQFQVLTTTEPCDNPNGVWESVYCLSPTGPPGSNGIIPLRDLTIGQRYYFMVDGFAGDLCEYQLNYEVPYDELFNFVGTADQSAIRMAWVVEDGYYFDQYRISRSINNENNWETVGQVNGTSNQSYLFTDSNPGQGFNYYRLELVGPDGEALCSKSIRVYYGDLGFTTINLFPNPASDFIYVEYATDSQTSVRIELFDLAGHLIVNSFDLPAQQIDNFFIDISALPAGAYILNLIQGDKRSTRKFIKAQ